VARRSELVRSQNARIAAAAHVHRFGTQSRVPFVCECDDHDCREFVPVTLPEYSLRCEEGTPLLAPGHSAASAEREAC
jgi:hypothetical protein